MTSTTTNTELAVQYVRQEIAERGFDWLQSNLKTAQQNLHSMGLGRFTIEVATGEDGKNYFRMVPRLNEEQS